MLTAAKVCVVLGAILMCIGYLTGGMQDWNAGDPPSKARPAPSVPPVYYELAGGAVTGVGLILLKVAQKR